jgi:hypothetical protein
MEVCAVRRLTVVAVAVGVLASLALTGASQAASAHTAPVGVMVRANGHQRLPLHGGTVDSLNWSGYAVTPSGGGITAVASTFVVPQAGLVPPGFAATWTGIGGFNTNDLIQAGTAEDSLPSLPVIGPQYFAWYELLPNAETPISGCSGDAACTVVPGEHVAVTINEVSGNTWHIAMTDAGHWSWAKNVTYHSSRSSAEWILEAPSLLVLQTIISPLGTTSFGPVSTFTVGRTTRTIAAGNPTRIILSPGVINEATPSALARNGQSFNDCTYTATCPTP